MGRNTERADGVYVGQKFGRWTITGPLWRDARFRAYHRVRCACGREGLRETWKLLNGDTRSCGCWAPELVSAFQQSRRRRSVAAV